MMVNLSNHITQPKWFSKEVPKTMRRENIDVSVNTNGIVVTIAIIALLSDMLKYELSVKAL